MAQQLVRRHAGAAAIDQLFKVNKPFMLRSIPRTTGDPDRLLTIAYNTIAYNSDLMECTPETLIGGVFEALKLGITLGGPMQEGWLLPFKNGRTGKKDATLIVGYMGYRNIIDRAGGVIDLHPRAVYEHDDFDFEFGVHPRIRHKPHWMVNQPKPGKLLAVYAVARLRRGGVQVEVMPVSEVEAHRQRSRARDSGPWKTDYDAMALKTVIRKISKYLPKSNELLSRALDLDEKADLGQDQVFDIEGLVIPQAALPDAGGASSRLNALKESLGVQSPPPPAEREPGSDDEGQDEGQADIDDKLAADIERKLEAERKLREGSQG